MAQVKQTKTQSRCLTCRRSKITAIREQIELGVPCDVPSGSCNFNTEILQAIEDKKKINIIAKPKPDIKISIIKKVKPKLNIKKK